MKKKLLLIVVMLVLSVTAITFAGSLQNRIQKSVVDDIVVNNKEENKVVQDEQNKQEIKENSEKEQNKESSNAVEKREQNKTSEIKKEGSKNSTTNVNNNGESKNKTQNNRDASKDNKSTSLKPNFYIIDTVNNKVLYKGYVDINSKSAGDVTLKVLIDNKISYRAKGTGGNIYFSSIAGLKERDYGENSGWCYYVNGVKPSVGAGSYILKDGDIVEWKYLEDGLK